MAITFDPSDFRVSDIVGKLLKRKNQWSPHPNDQRLGEEVNMWIIELDHVSFGKRDFKTSLDPRLEPWTKPFISNPCR